MHCLRQNYDSTSYNAFDGNSAARRSEDERLEVKTVAQQDLRRVDRVGRPINSSNSSGDSDALQLEGRLMSRQPFLPCDCECIRTVLLSKSVCPFVCLSGKRVHLDKTK